MCAFESMLYALQFLLLAQESLLCALESLLDASQLLSDARQLLLRALQLLPCALELRLYARHSFGAPPRCSNARLSSCCARWSCCSACWSRRLSRNRASSPALAHPFSRSRERASVQRNAPQVERPLSVWVSPIRVRRGCALTHRSRRGDPWAFGVG